MSGLQRPPWSKRYLVLLTAIILLAGASVALAFALTRTRAPTPLAVTDGSISGSIEGDFVNYQNTSAPLIRYFNATTYANESNGSPSTLALRLFTSAYFDPWSGMVMVVIHATVQGRFASDLQIEGLTLRCNQTGDFAAGQLAWGYPVTGPVELPGYTQPGPVNTSGGGQIALEAGPVAFTPTLLNRNGDGPVYEFVFPVLIEVHDPIGHDAFVGFQAAGTGSFAPSVSVSILLHVTNLPAGV